MVSVLPFNSAVPGLNTAEVYRNFIPVKLIEKKEKQLIITLCLPFPYKFDRNEKTTMEKIVTVLVNI